jgi:hypothetical protein
MTPHGLRHTTASLAIAAGGTVVLVSRMLGHASPTVTLKLPLRVEPRPAPRADGHPGEVRVDPLAPRLRHLDTSEPPLSPGASALHCQVRTDRPVIMLAERVADDRMSSDLGISWSRLGESNPRPTHYE